MNPTKIEIPRHAQTPVPLETIDQFKNACLDLRRSIHEMSDSSAKEMLLFYMDSLISLDIFSYEEEAKNSIERMRSILERTSVKLSLERQFVYLDDAFLTICKGSMSVKMAHFRRKHH
ncbi:MAG: hypothetical protein K0R24_362 [Gammaproteobacteria bacterium]|jgi:hypothetical protein|nr:hypothetical protein [Gammaproteobacteria bacterium]